MQYGNYDYVITLKKEIDGVGKAVTEGAAYCLVAPGMDVWLLVNEV